MYTSSSSSFSTTGTVFPFAEPDPPIKLEKMEETTNKISLALEIQEDSVKMKPGRCVSVCSIRKHVS